MLAGFGVMVTGPMTGSVFNTVAEAVLDPVAPYMSTAVAVHTMRCPGSEVSSMTVVDPVPPVDQA